MEFIQFGKITDFVTFRESYSEKTGYLYLIRMENKEVAKRAFIYNYENHCDFNIKVFFLLSHLTFLTDLVLCRFSARSLFILMFPESLNSILFIF